ncbi:MAG TPA: dTMP kinase [Arenicellales bacterium]|nr:dTMP kinase [Arenicellales bacterium]
MSRTSNLPGRFITVEGQDGAGKTTNLDVIEEIVRKAGYRVVRTREPGGTPLGDEIRRLVLHRQDLEIDAMAELLLIFAARAQHLAQVIRPALEAGAWVVCDRFTDATYAYQGGGRGVDMNAIAELERRVQDGLQPDLTLLFDVDAPTGARRANGRGSPDRFESEAESFRERVRDVYLSRARAEPERVRVVDASRDLEQVVNDVEEIMKGFIGSAG